MQLVQQPVTHKVFGKGVITGFSNKIITIRFAEGEKRFFYPDAFADFLLLQNKALQKEIKAACHEKRQAEQERQEKMQYDLERRNRLTNLKILPNAQAAFHLEAEEAEKALEQGFVETGLYLSGYAKGTPRIPGRLAPNSACLLTVCPKGEPEKERRIVGMFMVKDDFMGEFCKDGKVESHSEYKLLLDGKKAMRYWDYFEHGAELPRWGRVAFQYFENTVMQNILADAQKKLHKTAQEETAGQFYAYFCRLNHLRETEPQA